MKEFPKVPYDLVNAIKNCNRAVICGHVSPDGDCAYSSMAIGLLLDKLGKEHINVNEGGFDRPELADFSAIVSPSIPEDWLDCNTLGIVVDCSTIDRLGCYASYFEKLDIAVIDHHSSGESFGHYRYIVPDSISTTLLVYNVYKACSVDVDEQAARFIFRGFATDSGFFRFLGADSSPTFNIIAELVKKNIAPSTEYHAVNGNKPFENVKFLATLINRTESLYGGRLMISHEEPEDREKFSDNAKASDDLYAQLLSVKGTEVVLFFKQSRKVENAVEVGMRASHFTNIDVGKLAHYFGGGGHAKASGCTIKGTYEDVRTSVLDKIGEYFAC